MREMRHFFGEFQTLRKNANFYWIGKEWKMCGFRS